MSHVLAVGTTKGAFLFHAHNDRSEWKMTGPHMPGWDIDCLLVDVRDNNRLYAGTSHYAYGPTIRVSDDMGTTWQQLEARPAYPAETGFKFNRFWQLTGTPASQPHAIYAGIDEAGLFVTRDRGASWQELSALTRQPGRAKWFPGAGGLCLHTIVVDRGNPGRIWVGISAVGVFRTDDAGETWKSCNNGLPKLGTGSDETESACCVHKIVHDPQQANTLYMQYHGGVLRTTDGGDSWHKIEHGLPGNFGFPMVVSKRGELFVVPEDSDEKRYFRDGRFVVYRSRDRGESWQPLSRGLPGEAVYAGVLRDAMAADNCDPAGVYIGTTMGQLFASTDAGESWRQLPGQFPRIKWVKCYELG